MPIERDPEVSEGAIRAFQAMLGCLDGLFPDEARSVAANVLARVLMVEAPDKLMALEWVDAISRDVKECIEGNWENIEDERAKNGGEPRTWERN